MSESTGFDKVSFRLESWKRQLIDLSRRNRLLNFKPQKRSTLAIVGRPARDVLTMVQEVPRLHFLARTLDKGENEAAEASSVASRAGLEPDRAERGYLETRLSEEDLEKNLVTISRRAWEGLENQGINSLFLALGMLRWFESSDSDTENLAPILLVPVSLERKKVLSQFTLELGDDEPLINPALVEKLRQDFELTAPELQATEDLELDLIFEQFEKLIEDSPRWRIVPQVHLGLFSFQKFVMYRDIERNAGRYRENRLIQVFSRQQTLHETEPSYFQLPPNLLEADLDKEMSPWDTVQVVDADSSQQRAMLAVRTGCDLVIEGPPGTGKSQTITNVIADALYRGQRVLFVSEKMAALEVVKTRLEEVGLGNSCLELHSNKTSKKDHVRKLAQALDQEPVEERPSESDLKELQHLTNQLQSYVVALHQPAESLDVSPFDAIGEWSLVREAPDSRVELREIRDIDREALSRSLSQLRDLTTTLRQIGDPSSHPLRGFGLTQPGRRDRSGIQASAEAASEHLRELESAAQELAEWLGLRPLETLGSVEPATKAVRVLAVSPGVEESVLANPSWNAMPAAAEEILSLGEQCAAWRIEIVAFCREEVLGADLNAELARYEELLARGVWRFFLPDYWRLRKRLSSLFHEKPPTDSDRLRILRLAMECRAGHLRLGELDDEGQQLFGHRWRYLDSDWEDLRQFADWVQRFRSCAMQDLFGPAAFKLAASARQDPAECEHQASRLEQALLTTIEQLHDLEEKAKLRPESELRVDHSAKLTTLRLRTDQVLENLDRLNEYAAYVEAAEACLANDLLAGFVRWAIREIPSECMVDSFQRLFWETWLDGVISERDALAAFRTDRQEGRIETFRQLDRKSRYLARLRTLLVLSEARKMLLDRELSTQLQRVQREASKQRMILPIRKLLAQSGDVISLIKPCFMMSPLSVAQYLDGDRPPFDLLVFDEASQIPTADAVGSIVRAKQVVVVGDSKQLPPTNFFSIQIEDEDRLNDDGLELLEDLESVLEEAATSGIPRTRLKWHYRSQHESLIRFSNEEFYRDDPLYVFPSIDRQRSDSGLQFEHVSDGIYEGNGVNGVEARRVADAVVDHAREHPELSLGVGTFGINQQTRILDELDQLRKAHPDIEWFFNQSGQDKFFVKNLENIQGDDRDVIFLSVTFGPDANGVIRRNFGPINKDNGWRRLNVLTTRAKKRLRVFSSMTADQLDVRNVRQGAVLLKQYLYFAETGEYQSPKIPVGEPDSPFEEEVRDALRLRGYEVVSQVGEAGYRVDLAVIDPEHPGRYLCGIECDGASYHRAATVRDRDRLRQQVLEDRGWDIHRIWSTDWFREPTLQTDRLQKLIEESRDRREKRAEENEQAARLPDPFPDGDSLEALDAVSSKGPTEVSDTHRPARNLSVPPYRFAHIRRVGSRKEFYEATIDELARLVREVVSVEGPIHVVELTRRVASFWGFRSPGRTIRDHVRAAIELLLHSGWLLEEEDALRRAAQKEIPVRSRDVAGSTFSSNEVPLCEIEQAIRLLLAHRQPLVPDELVSKTARLLGFGRTGKVLREKIEKAKDRLVEANELRAGGRGIVLSKPGSE